MFISGNLEDEFEQIGERTFRPFDAQKLLVACLAQRDAKLLSAT